MSEETAAVVPKLAAEIKSLDVLFEAETGTICTVFVDVKTEAGSVLATLASTVYVDRD